jgi:signal peptidase
MKLSKAAILSFVKDLFVAAIIILIILTAMYGYTRVWPPIVVIESTSMEHGNAPYGRIGTIDAGDFTFVKKVDSKDEIVTYYRGRSIGYSTYSNYGDVIIFQKDGKAGTPIIHRAILWVELNYTENGLRYDIPELGWFGNDSITIKELELQKYQPPHSGFITKGDNNPRCDQKDSLPVSFEWIIGVARGEIPWFGSIKLLFDDLTTNSANAGNVRQDCWAMLCVSIAILITVPVAIDYSYPFIKSKFFELIERRKKRRALKKELDKLEKVEFQIERK